MIDIKRVPEETDNVVSISVNGRKKKLFVDSGCKKTLLPMIEYHPSMGELQETPTMFRPYGTETRLPAAGKLTTKLKTINGASVQTTVYFIDAPGIEPLLGDADAKTLGILVINKEGSAGEEEDEQVAAITEDLRRAGITVQTGLKKEEEVPPKEQKRIEEIVRDNDEVFQEYSGLLKDDHATFHIDKTVPPVAAPYRPTPLAFREKLSKHLDNLRAHKKIKPDEHCPWISNVVLTEKNETDEIRMNIDMREPNKALLRTPQHIETLQEIRHLLKGANRFSEIDLSHGYHQIALDPQSQEISVFQTHEGLHKFCVLFFGASPASEIFHNKIKEAIRGLEGVVSIHDNILIYGTPDTHECNLKACLQRLKEKGLTLRRKKCKFGKTSVTWFGYIFSESGMSADPKKIEAITKAGRPQTTEEVRSFLQACQYNAKFMFDSEMAYAQVTHPLRELTKKGAHFKWSEACETVYREILKLMTPETALRPFDPKLKTNMITDAGPMGIAASVFQEERADEWVPIDHASRSLTPCEQGYAQIEKESLAQAWGMNMHRYYSTTS